MGACLIEFANVCSSNHIFLVSRDVSNEFLIGAQRKQLDGKYICAWVMHDFIFHHMELNESVWQNNAEI